MDSDMSDMVSPSQSSPSMSGNVGQTKGGSVSENSSLVRMHINGVCLHFIKLFFSSF